MLTVVTVASPFSLVSREVAGGAGQIIASVDHALVQDGHRSIVVASAGSRCEGELVPTPIPPENLDERSMDAAWREHRSTLERVIARLRVDVIHLHGEDFHRYWPPAGPTAVATLQLPPALYPPDALSGRPGTWFLTSSRSQRNACPPGLPLLEEIPGGVFAEEFPAAAVKERYALVLGTIRPGRGIHLAIQAALLAGVPLRIAGPLPPLEAHIRYFQERIAPLLSDEVRYLGPISGARKRALLSRARCVLFSSVIPETRALVAMEALASGTPVIAFHRGALPEIVDEGRTGFLVETVEEMAAAIARTGDLSSETCRRLARTRFPADAMNRKHLELYRRLAAESRPPDAIVEGTASSRHRRRSRVGAVAIEETRDPSDLEGLSEEWTSLADACAWATPFQRPEWLLPFARRFAPGSAWFVLLRREGVLCGLAPMRLALRDGLRVLSLLGGPLAGHLDVLLNPATDGAASSALVDHFRRRREVWDLCELERLQPESPLRTLPLPDGWTSSFEPQTAGAVLRLPDSLDRLLDSLPASRREEIERKRKSHERSLQITESTAETLDADLSALFRLLAGRGQLREPSFEAFHREVAHGLLKSGRLRLFAAREAGHVLAMHLGLVSGARWFCHIAGFASDADGVGTLLTAHAIDQAIRSGATRMDFPRDGEAWKHGWGAVDRTDEIRRLRHGSA